jgi:predicted nucleotidyltransferase
VEDGTVSEPRRALELVTSLITRHFGGALHGLYLFGSLPAGDFRPGKSDLDLVAVLGADVQDGEELEALTELHSGFVADHPDWRERIEVGYISHTVLQTLGETPAGRVAVISPGEPLNIKDVGAEWILDWRSVCTQGETIVGPPPREIGPEITDEAFRRAVELQLEKWTEDARAPWVAYVPAHQGYIVVTICRAMYALSTGEQTSKEEAVAWAAKRFPAWSDFVYDALAQYRADLTEQHMATVAFVDYAASEAHRLDQS